MKKAEEKLFSIMKFCYANIEYWITPQITHSFPISSNKTTCYSKQRWSSPFYLIFLCVLRMEEKLILFIVRPSEQKKLWFLIYMYPCKCFFISKTIIKLQTIMHWYLLFFNVKLVILRIFVYVLMVSYASINALGYTFPNVYTRKYSEFIILLGFGVNFIFSKKLFETNDRCQFWH